jgi:hypothetical protein
LITQIPKGLKGLHLAPDWTSMVFFGPWPGVVASEAVWPVVGNGGINYDSDWLLVALSLNHRRATPELWP